MVWVRKWCSCGSAAVYLQFFSLFFCENKPKTHLNPWAVRSVFCSGRREEDSTKGTRKMCSAWLGHVEKRQRSRQYMNFWKCEDEGGKNIRLLMNSKEKREILAEFITPSSSSYTPPVRPHHWRPCVAAACPCSMCHAAYPEF